MDKKVVTFIIDRINFDFETPYELLPGKSIRRANSAEIEKIKEGLQLHFGGIDLRKYECEVIEGKCSYLPHEKWLYWLIESFEETNLDTNRLSHAFLLSKTELRTGIQNFFVKENGH
ncbi:MAG: hypothetical protein R2825_01890 [Saprospiraceae bacterium]